MSNSTPTYNFFPTPPIQTGEHRTLSLSHSQHPPLKKQRICEALVVDPRPRVPVMSKSSNPNLVDRPLNGNNNIVAEMQLCRMFYYRRKCRYADKCRFSHVNPEKDEQDLGSGDRRSGYGPFASKESTKSATRKTKLCKKWEMTGGRGCLYGNTCYFAHGQAELRKLGRHNASASRFVGMNISNNFSTGNARSGKQGLEDESRCVFKWKSLEKISGIYADWIEDIPLFQSSLSK